MVKKFFLMLAVLIFTAQIQTVYADVAIPERPRAFQAPIKLSVESIDEENNQVTLKLSLKKSDVQKYLYSIYRESGLYVTGGTGNFDSKTALITFDYDDLSNDTPETLRVEIETEIQYAPTNFGNKLRQRPSYLQMNYIIEFTRYGDELTAEVSYDR